MRTDGMASDEAIVPPWVEFPEVTPRALQSAQAWSEYVGRWRQFLISLTPAARDGYEERFPVPGEWKDFYRLARAHSELGHS